MSAELARIESCISGRLRPWTIAYRIGTAIRLMSKDATSPAASERASPWKTGSKRIAADPTITARAVRSIGRKRTAPASTTASATGIPSRILSSAKSTRMIEFRTTIPAPAMKPMRDVAVKNAPSAACAGKMPTSEKGMGAMTTRGVEKERNHPTSIA